MFKLFRSHCFLPVPAMHRAVAPDNHNSDANAPRRRFKQRGFVATLLLAICFLAACRTTSPFPPINSREPGWTIRHGQAVWRANDKAPEIAGELLVASHADGRSLVQFTKTPLPFVVAQTSAHTWQIHFVPQNKTYSGRGEPPDRLIWLHLSRCLSGTKPPPMWNWLTMGDERWRLENRSTGESLEGYLTTTTNGF